MIITKRALLGAVVALSVATPLTVASAKDLTILTSVPGLNFPFFVHMMNGDAGRGVRRLGRQDSSRVRRAEQSAPKQTADVEAGGGAGASSGIVISPDRRQRHGAGDQGPRSTTACRW